MQSLMVLHCEILDETVYHNLGELSHYATASIEDIVAMVDEGILEPVGDSPEHWVFSLRDFERARVVARLQHDLAVNLSGAAIIIELLEKN